MAINKEKNVSVQITLSKEDAQKLDTLVDAFNKNNIKSTRSSCIAHALNEYIKILVATSLADLKSQEKQSKQAKEDKKDA